MFGVQAMIIVSNVYYGAEEDGRRDGNNNSNNTEDNNDKDIININNSKEFLPPEEIPFFSGETAVEVLLSLWEITVDFDRDSLLYQNIHQRGYRCGDLQLSTILCTLNNLSLSSLASSFSKKRMMDRLPVIVDLAGRTLLDYHQNKSPYWQKDDDLAMEFVGGGGEDHRSIKFLCTVSSVVILIWY
jgi:hypothetical protein